MRTTKRSRFFAALLALVMILTLMPMSVFAAETADHVVINQAYGGGGNSGATFKNDFIELYNPTDKDVSLEGWSVQYAAKTGNFNNMTVLSGVIKAHGYYLISEAAGTGGTEDLPEPDAIGGIAMGSKDFKLALVSGADAISGKSDSKVVDFLGVGAANEYEGTAAAPALSNTTAALRVADGVDTDENSVDFCTAAPNPRNSKTAQPTPYDDIDAEFSVFEKVDKPAAGDTVVVYSASGAKALSSVPLSTYYLTAADVTLTEKGYMAIKPADAAALQWVVGEEEGTYTFTQDDMMLSAYANGTKRNISTDATKETGWILDVCNAENSSYYVYNKTVESSNGHVYLEWYAKYTEFTVYDTSAERLSEDAFGMTFYKLVREGVEKPTGKLPADGDEVVIYNASAAGVLGQPNDMNISLECAPAELKDGAAVAGNGALVFTVGVDGEDFTFMCGGKYLASNNDEYVFLTEDETANIKWNLVESDNGLIIYSKDSVYISSSGASNKICIEYYGGSFSGYSFKASSREIFEFNFLPLAEGITLTDGVVNMPEVTFSAGDAYAGADYTMRFTVDAVFGVGEIAVLLGDEAITAVADSDGYTVSVPAEKISGESLVFSVSGKDVKDVAFEGTVTVKVIDEPSVGAVSPAANAEYTADKRPVITAEVVNAGEDATVVMTLNGSEVETVYADGKATFTPAEDFADGKVSVSLSVTRADGKSVVKNWSFFVGKAQYQLYFGQLHSHTAEYSDGAGTLAAGLDYVKNLPESANVQFVAFTDHSNYFDTSSAANPEQALYDMSLATEASREKWAKYRGAVEEFNASQSDVVAIAGFEMTWSGGPGHINTFNSTGIVSRNNKTLNDKTSDAGLKAYYSLLSQAEGAGTVSQLNHPGTTFGTFADFAYWDAVIDSRVFLVEVGNGEGQIGAGGYYPSYEQYIIALDKGWHVAPTNNQDNHKGKWGNANDARDVILTSDFSEEGLYQAMRDMRVYATEDKNLEIIYTVNGLMLGSSITEVPEELNFSVSVNDPDATDSISKVELVANSGKVVYTWDNPTELAGGALSVTLKPEYSYYFVRVTEGDGDLAVTAPVWVGESLKLGISSIECGTSTPVTGEELTISTVVFNSESSPATVKSVVYTTDGSKVIGTDDTAYTVAAGSNCTIKFNYTPEVAKVMTVTATVTVEQDGKEFTFSKDITLDVLNADELVYIGIDASHHNEYVNGNYKDSMGNFGGLAAGFSVRTVQLNTSDELIAAAQNADGKYVALVLTAPSRRDGNGLRNPYDTYTDAELEAIKSFNANGGTVVLCGWGDYYESYAEFTQSEHMSAEQNKVLAALGSSLRISDDETKDNAHNGGQAQRLYLSSYNFDSFLLDRVEYDAEHPYENMYTELYSQYGGASIYVVDGEGNPTTAVPATVTPTVFGFDTTESYDDDKDSFGGLGAIPKYSFDGAERLMVMATEQLEGKGLIVVSGAAFLSNFEVQATISDSGAEKNYSNYKICENLVQYLNPVTVTPIATVQKQTEAGFKYTIEGTVTTNASGYDKNTAFFDCIYVQDATGGVCCFPVAGDFRIGDKVRVTGTTDFFQGEMELQVTAIQKIGEGDAVSPAEVTAAQINDGSVLGQFITLKGVVKSFSLDNGLVQTIMVEDAQGNVARVFIDGYICSSEDVKNIRVGCEISVSGVASYDDTFNAPEGPFPRIRVNDRANVVCGDVAADPFTDIADSGYRTWIVEAADVGIISGYADGTFRPNAVVTRGQFVTMLYRAAGSPETDGDISFTDAGDIYAGYKSAVVWGVENGIIAGYTDGSFKPNQSISRAQMAAFLYRYLVNVENYDFGEVKDMTFADKDSIASAYYDAVAAIVSEGIMYGTSSDTFAPNGTANRGMAATVILRVYNTLH
ncbi:MAG: S-layer homology domain-containing protein [Oscillospiraceae bacterium]|nr:S-layer homology domain-containing protein [Oscillospiraceae bacterium]